MIFTMLIVLLKFWQQISYYFGKDNFPLDMTKSLRFVPKISIYFANFIVPSTWHDAPITIKHKHITSTPWYFTYSQFVVVPIQVLNPFWHYSVHTTVIFTNTYFRFVAKYDIAHFSTFFCTSLIAFVSLHIQFWLPCFFLLHVHTYIYFLKGSSFNGILMVLEDHCWRL